MDKDIPQLKDGAEWIDHEDCIIGNEAGIRSLKNACEVALEEGQYFGNDLGDYVGVKQLEAEWFEKPQDSSQTRIGNIILGMVLLLLAGLILVGVGTVIQWLVT